MEKRNSKLATVLALIFFGLFCGSALINYKLAKYLDEYDEQIEKQDSMIRKLTFSNELVQEYFDINEDTITHTTTYSLKDSKREKVIEHVTNHVDHVFIKDGKEMSSDELIASINEDNKKAAEIIRIFVGKYNTLVHDYNELGKNFSLEHDTVVIQGMALGLIKRNYGIDYVANQNGDTRTVKVIGEKVDSALMLLPYYRHKLTYDSLKKAWFVEYDKKAKKNTK